MFEKIPQLIHNHHGTIFFGFSRRCAKMGKGDHLGMMTQLQRGKIREVVLEFLRLQTGDHGIVINQAIAGEIEQHGVVAHECDAFRVDQIPGFFQ